MVESDMRRHFRFSSVSDANVLASATYRILRRQLNQKSFRAQAADIINHMIVARAMRRLWDDGSALTAR